jgi:multicomponent Na+:H+ antiporter subunit C
MDIYPFVVAAVLFGAGIYGVVTSRDFIHTAVCLSVMQSSTYVALLGVGYVRGGTAPIQQDFPAHGHPVDPVVQALTLTDVVVSVVVLALILALAIQTHRHAGAIDPDRLQEMRG